MIRPDADDNGAMNVQAIMVLLLLTVLLVAILFAALSHFIRFPFDPGMQTTDRIFEITAVRHYSEDGVTMNYDSRLTLWYNDSPDTFDIGDPADLLAVYCGYSRDNPDRTRQYVKDDLTAQFYCNGEPVYAVIGTLDAHLFIPTHHNGVQYMTGTGSVWCPNAKITIDFRDGTFRPGDVVRVEVRSKSAGRVISADTATA
ncbi:hypothetical protein [Methanofollis fontis]|uniref:Archaeal Type IV pilin N-terminal domain-containing protein n=1 Tax=Methanofollis fontis TaxID=2052832 RepID=A0A483CXI6_9EURY|nr:hypothetical protein [Methanofollis fontis]TAJ44003.1 hypothetical protein CUJ86_08135 [Methanofollis fontis]